MLKHYGARLISRSSLGNAIATWVMHPQRLLPSSYFMYAGCSQPEAVFAYVNAVLELALQVAAGDCPMPKDIVVAAGSGARSEERRVGKEGRARRTPERER